MKNVRNIAPRELMVMAVNTTAVVNMPLDVSLLPANAFVRKVGRRRFELGMEAINDHNNGTLL